MTTPRRPDPLLLWPAAPRRRSWLDALAQLIAKAR